MSPVYLPKRYSTFVRAKSIAGIAPDVPLKYLGAVDREDMSFSDVSIGIHVREFRKNGGVLH